VGNEDSVRPGDERFIEELFTTRSLPPD